MLYFTVSWLGFITQATDIDRDRTQKNQTPAKKRHNFFSETNEPKIGAECFYFHSHRGVTLGQVTAPNKQTIKHVLSPRAPANHMHHGLISSSKVEDEERDNGEEQNFVTAQAFKLPFSVSEQMKIEQQN